MRVLSVEEARTIDTEVARRGRIPLAWLMENAGRGVADYISKVSTDTDCILFVLGTGNNGADGLVAARHLLTQGVLSKIVVLGNQEERSELFKEQLLALQDTPLEVQFICSTEGEDFDYSTWQTYFAEATIIIEGIAGTGLVGPLRKPVDSLVKVLQNLRARGVKVISIDMPLGVSGDTGEVQPIHLAVDATVTMVAPKQGMYCYPGKKACGEIVVVSIGYPLPWMYLHHTPFTKEERNATYVVTQELASKIIPKRAITSHKGLHGHVLIIGGDDHMLGAPIMTATATMQAGAGKATIAVDSELQNLAMLKCIPEVMVQSLNPRRIAEGLEHKDAIVIGPGWGRKDVRINILSAMLPLYLGPIVVDADGLYALGKAKESRLKGWQHRDIPAILTPHVGEFSRLTGYTASYIESHRIEVAREFSTTYGVVLLLKGAPTVVATPEGNVYINTTGNPGMGSAGMGDVLGGIIGAFLGQGLVPTEAAVLGAYVHGKSADLLATSKSIGLLASDVASIVGNSLKEMADAK